MNQLAFWSDLAPETHHAANTRQGSLQSKLAERCRQSAASLEKVILAKHDSASNMLKLPATRKRLQDATHMRNDAIRLERMQLMFRQLADMHEKGTVPNELQPVTSVAALERALYGRQSNRVACNFFQALPTVELKEHRIQLLTAQAALKDIHGFVPTPLEVADLLVSVAQIGKSHTVLEPSAGTGNLMDAVLRVSPQSTLFYCEINCFLLDILHQKYDGQSNIHFAGRDCLELDTSKRFDRIIMNPAFEGGQDVAQVLHLYELLKRKGFLISILGDGAFRRSDHKAKDFQQLLSTKGEVIKDLDPATFKSSGVNVRSKIIRLTA